MIANLSQKAFNLIGSLRGQRGAVAFEYLLIVGVVSVAIVAAIALVDTPLTDKVIAGVCGAINTVMDPDIACAGIGAA